MIHKSGSSHGNADALSRLPLPGSAPAVTPQPAETVLLFEELQNGPVTADQIKMCVHCNFNNSCILIIIIVISKYCNRKHMLLKQLLF